MQHTLNSREILPSRGSVHTPPELWGAPRQAESCPWQAAEPLPQHTAPWAAGTLLARTALGTPACTATFTALQPALAQGSPHALALPRCSREALLCSTLASSTAKGSHTVPQAGGAPAAADPASNCRGIALQPHTYRLKGSAHFSSRELSAASHQPLSSPCLPPLPLWLPSSCPWGCRGTCWAAGWCNH